ncbi:hypothetical protein IKA15_00220 [bacterium]|nr:hypothetical protein [bacterium]
MKKIISAILCSFLLSGCAFWEQDKTDVLTLFSTKSHSTNKAWVGTFQLVWNDMKNNIIGHDIIFRGEKPTSELIGLNSEEFNSSMLNKSSYYTSYGKTSPFAKEKIKKDVYKKFEEKSDVLDMADWSEGEGKYYAYAMLKKEFEFLEEFEELEKGTFNNKGEFKYFGITNESKETLDNNVQVLFHNNKNDYAVQLLTVSGDIIYLYRTNSSAPFDKIYEKMLVKTEKYEGEREFNVKDTIKVPNLKINEIRKYPTLTDRTIEGTANLYFSEAIETLQLELDNKGGKVKSEALLMSKCNMISPSENEPPREFNFDKTFVMFLIDKEKENPFLALRVKSLSEFQKD